MYEGRNEVQLRPPLTPIPLGGPFHRLGYVSNNSACSPTQELK